MLFGSFLPPLLRYINHQLQVKLRRLKRQLLPGGFLWEMSNLFPRCSCPISAWALTAFSAHTLVFCPLLVPPRQPQRGRWAVPHGVRPPRSPRRAPSLFGPEQTQLLFTRSSPWKEHTSAGWPQLRLLCARVLRQQQRLSPAPAAMWSLTARLSTWPIFIYFFFNLQEY